MARFYIQVGPNLYYQFNAPATAYPTTVADELGVLSTRPPVPALVTRAGTFADWGIARVRLAVVNPTTGLTLSNPIRLCDVDNFSSATVNLAGVTAFGGRIDAVYPVRKRISL